MGDEEEAVIRTAYKEAEALAAAALASAGVEGGAAAAVDVDVVGAVVVVEARAMDRLPSALNLRAAWSQ